MHRLVHVLLGFLVASGLACGSAQAAVADSAANGFSVVETIHIAAPPAKVWAELIVPSHWWSAVHSYSHNAANFSLEPRAGGCWCETLPNGGSVQHAVVVRLIPDTTLVVRGAFGPLQSLGVEGALTVVLKPAAGGTDLTATYNVGGYLKDGLAALGTPVDSVIGEQFNRFKSQVETGSPEPKKEP
jgi:uncharacterized protein YndB with AHSA1/START domain